MYKKIALSIGAISAIVAPAAMAISCGAGNSESNTSNTSNGSNGSNDGDDKKTPVLDWEKKAGEGLKLQVIYSSKWEKEVYDTNDVKVNNPVWVKKANLQMIFDFELKSDPAGRWYALYNTGSRIYEANFNNIISEDKIDFQGWISGKTEEEIINDKIAENIQNGNKGVILEGYEISNIIYVKK